ncbi:MAG: HAD family hydrolase [Clostridia bacterium]|nr:HAD family hydrolase [Clostridia bacterium]
MDTKAVIFDKDGTLLDFDACWLKIADYAIADIMEQFNARDIPADEVVSALGVCNGIASILGALCCGTYTQIGTIIHNIFEQYKHNFNEDEVIAATIDAFENNSNKGEIKAACDNIADVLLTLKSYNLKLAVVTTDTHSSTMKHLEALGIKDLFDAIYTDDGSFPAKPHPFCINDFCEREGLLTSQVVMVGDTLTDVSFAHNGGIDMIGVSKSEANTAILKNKTPIVVPDISYVLDAIKQQGD